MFPINYCQDIYNSRAQAFLSSFNDVFTARSKKPIIKIREEKRIPVCPNFMIRLCIKKLEIKNVMIEEKYYNCIAIEE